MRMKLQGNSGRGKSRRGPVETKRRFRCRGGDATRGAMTTIFDSLGLAGSNRLFSNK
jgi:hypothetical protein